MKRRGSGPSEAYVLCPNARKWFLLRLAARIRQRAVTEREDRPAPRVRLRRGVHPRASLWRPQLFARLPKAG